MFIVRYTKLKNRISIRFLGFHGSLFKYRWNLTCVIRSFQLGYHALNFAIFSSEIPRKWRTNTINHLNTKLNPICPLLALFGAHRILHVSGIRVKYQAPHPSSPWARSCRGSSIAYEACIRRQFVTRFPATVQRTLLHVKLSKCQPPASK